MVKLGKHHQLCVVLWEGSDSKQATRPGLLVEGETDSDSHGDDHNSDGEGVRDVAASVGN